MNSISLLRNRLEQARGKRTQVENQIEQTDEFLKNEKRSLRQHEQAREIIRDVGLKTQQELQYHISDVTSLALNAVFDDPYELKVEFVQRRNKTECDLLFVRDGDPMNPLTASGGGAVDVASFALRVASWVMERPRTRNTIILDEPMRFLSTNYQQQASEMIKELSQRLGVQFIIITHEEELTTMADKVFKVSIKAGVSKIKEQDGLS